ncbi:MAG: tetratricopeptide repeat protein [Phycisphaerales bacterium]
MHRSNSRTLLVSSSLLIATLAGCAGQGNYTRQGVSAAKERMSFLKSATEWELARQAFLAGDLEKALDKVETSLSINDTVVKSHVLKGRILIEMGDLSNALKTLNTAVTLDPYDSDGHYYLGVIHERINQPELAQASFEQACELDDYNPVYAVAAAEMLIDLDRIEDAKAYLGSIPMAENNAGIRQTLGHIALIERDTALAVKCFDEARMLAPDDEGIVEDLVHAQLQAGKWNDAERNISLLLKKPKNAERRDLKILHAKALANTGRAIEARSIYQELLSSSEGKSDVDSWVGMANASFMLNDMRGVRKAASRVVAMAPDAHDGYLLYAMYHRQTGDLDSALASIENALRRRPVDAGMFAFRALVLTDLDRQKDAIASVTRAVELEPSNPRYAKMLTQITSGTYAGVVVD